MSVEPGGVASGPAGGLSPWVGVRVRSRCEKMAADSLRGKGYEVFLPLYRARRQWSDRVKVIEQPLFPGYLFCRLDVTARAPVVETPGVVSFVSFGRTPAAVDEQVIRNIQEIIRSGLPMGPWPYLREGQRVEVSQGPLKGLRGILTRLKNEFRVVVSVTLLQRSVAVEVDREIVRPL